VLICKISQTCKNASDELARFGMIQDIYIYPFMQTKRHFMDSSSHQGLGLGGSAMRYVQWVTNRAMFIILFSLIVSL
jgi:hypothetical protein